MARQQFDRAAERRFAALHEAVDHQLDDLRHVLAFCNALGEVPRATFAKVVGHVLQQRPELLAIEWVPVVSEAERPDREAAARADGLTDFGFRDAVGAVLPSGSGHDGLYYPVFYVEPLAGNERALGFDLGSEPERLRALSEARDSGHAVVSAPVRLVQSDGGPDAVLVFVPRYAAAAVPASQLQRRQQLRGFVLGVLDVRRLVATVVARFADDLVHVALEDPATASHGRLLAGGADAVVAGGPQAEDEIVVGGRRWLARCTVAPGFDAGGVPTVPWVMLVVGAVLTLVGAGYVRNLSGRSRAELAFVDSEERTRAIIDSALDAIISTEADGTITGWNAGAETIFGWEGTAALGQDLSSLLFRPPHRAAVQERFADSWQPAPGSRHRVLELRAVRQSGEEFPVELAITPLPLHPDGGRRFSVFARDTSWRQRAQQELRDSERRYRTLVEHAPEAVVLLDAKSGCFVEVNRNAEALFKLDRQALRAMGPLDLSPPEQPDGRPSSVLADDYIAQALDGGAPVFPWMHLDADGGSVPCEVRLVQLPHAERVLIRGSITDMTERTRAEQRQSLMMRELDHRVKNNLATMLALAEQSAANAGSIVDFRDSFVHRVRAMARTHEALAANRWGGVPLAEVVRLTLDPYARQADRIHATGDAFMLAASASAAMSMAMNELATNAAKYGALSEAEGRVDVQWSVHDDELRVDWRESGGPAVMPPRRTGFGTTLLRGVIGHELRGTVGLDYAAAGLRCRIRVPVAGNRYAAEG